MLQKWLVRNARINHLELIRFLIIKQSALEKQATTNWFYNTQFFFYLSSMASFCLAGNVESSSFTHAERLCDILKQTLPACDIQKYVCLSKQWKLAQAQVCNEKGFDLTEVQKLQCAVWHEDGRFIGGADAFAQYCKSTYSVKSDWN
jgi:hypothetical protein